MTQPSSKYATHRSRNLSSANSSDASLVASSTRTVGRLRGLVTVSTFQTPWPPLPRLRLITRGPAASRVSNSARIASASVECRVTAPAHRASTMEHLLGAHLEDHIGMGAHPDAVRR